MSDTTMDALFGGAQEVETEVAQDTKTIGDKEAKKLKAKEMMAALQEKAAADPNYADRVRSYSDYIEVVNTLGFGKNGNIKEDKEAKTANGARALVPTGKIVGYIVKNNGDQTIPYQTEVWTKDETGKYVGTPTTKQWAPGEEIVLNRKYMTMVCSIPEISMTLSNGIIVTGSSKATGASLDQQLAAYYFNFNRETGKSVNDDAVKLTIDVDGVVKPEYEGVFGYLNNPKEPKTRQSKGTSGSKYTIQDAAAAYIQKLLNNN